ncbi:MAG: alpha/beta hydrolase [Caldilineaceae bacterium]|nr:alpha/beta hydrolase [Caldilineaceae bacterium]
MSTPALLTVSDYVQLPGVPATARYPYGDDPEQFADLYLPPTTPPAAGYPVVVLIHGGCWGAQYGLTQLGPFSRTIADLGIAVWSLEYRRIGNGGGWPNTFLDVAAGADFLRTIADEETLDLHRVAVAGHSAGGHLALWLAARSKLATDSELYIADPLPLIGVVSLAGIPDLVDAEAREICRGAVPQLLGGSAADVPIRYRDASPSAFLPLGIP